MFIGDSVGVGSSTKCKGYLNLPFWASVSPFVNCRDVSSQGFLNFFFQWQNNFSGQNLTWNCNKKKTDQVELFWDGGAPLEYSTPHS